jgi:hypothetical protein
MDVQTEHRQPDPPAGARQLRLWHLFFLIGACGAAFAILRELGTEGMPLAIFVLIAATVIAWSMRHGEAAVAKTVAIVFVFFLLLSTMYFPSVESGSKPAGPRAHCWNNLRNIALALQNYEASKGAFPPAYIADAQGKPMHSWRVLILPQLDRNDLYKKYRFDEPWDGPNNRLLHNEIMSIYQCPGDEGIRGSTQTSYLAVLGDRTAWPGAKARSVAEIDSKDGADRTILLVETHNSGVHWMEPRDLELDWCLTGMDGPLAGKLPGTHSNHATGGMVALVNGEVRFISNDTPAAELEALLNFDDGRPDKAPE